MLQAKFVCEKVDDADHGAGKVSETVTLHAAYSPDPASENYQWSQMTPNGQLTMMVTNPDAFGCFTRGCEYLLNFTPA